MRFIALFIVMYIGVSAFIPFGQCQCEQRFDSCVSNTEYRTQAETVVVTETTQVINSVRAFAQVGTGIYDLLSVPASSRIPLREVLTDVVPDILKYLTPVNATFFEPYLDEAFRLLDEFFNQFIGFNVNDVDRSVSNLVTTLDDGINLAFDIVNTVSIDDPTTQSIIMQINVIRNLPGFKDNATCLLQQIVRDPNIGVIARHLELLDDLIDDVASFVSPIARLFRNGSRFVDKFNQILQQFTSSAALQLCVDAMLTNIACPQFENLVQSGICQGTCVDSLRYCSALVFQSFGDFSDVLDAASLLTLEEAVSTEFEIFYNETIELSLEVLNSTLFALERLDILGVISNSVTTCRSESIISDVLQMFNIAIPPEQIVQFYASIIPENPLANVTELYDEYLSLTQSIPFRNIRDSVQAITVPSGFVANSLFSLSIQYSQDYFPPMGCSSVSEQQSTPLILNQQFSFFSNCWNGTMIVNFLFPLQFFEISVIAQDVGNNPAALRTCSFSDANFMAARLITTTNLCESFTDVIGNPRIANFLLVILTSDITALPTCRIAITQFLALPIPAVPVVNFQLPTYFATINALLIAICVSPGTNVQLRIFTPNDIDLNVTTVASSTPISQQVILNFTPTTIGTYIFTCQGSNSAGDTRSTTMVIVQSFSDNVDAISNFRSDSALEPEEAIELISILTSISNAEELQNNGTTAQQFADVTFAVADSLENTNISSDDAGALLGVLESVESIPVLIMATNAPPGQGETNLGVSEVIVRVSQSIDRLSLNLARQAQVGAPPTIVQSSGITIAALAIQPSNRILTFELSDVRVSFPSNFGNFERIEIGAAIRNSVLRAVVQPGQQVVLGAIPLLNSDLFNLNIVQDGNPNPTFDPPITFELGTSLIPANAENVCVFLDENTQEFRQGDVITNSSSSLSNVTVCQTSHLTSFGVLVRAQSIPLSEAETFALSIVSYTLLSISLIFLVLSIILFLISAKSFFKVETNILYFNYAVALALATSVFIFGVQTARNSLVGCSVVGFLMHYTWLSVFSWSFAISMFMVYILYFGILNRKKIWWLIMIIGWGLPLPFVIPTFGVGAFRNASINLGEYINLGDHCFLSYVNGLIWGFLGPFVFLIIASSVGAILSIIKIFLTVHGKGNKPQDLNMLINLVVTVLVLLPVLSVPWIIGIVNAFISSVVTTTVIEWITILFTAPVGVLFFIMVTIRNPQVQEVIFRRKPQQPSSISKQSSDVLSSKYALPKAKRSVTSTVIKNPSTNEGLPPIETEKDVLRNMYDAVQPKSVDHYYEQMDINRADTVKDVEKDVSDYANTSLDVDGQD